MLDTSKQKSFLETVKGGRSRGEVDHRIAEYNVMVLVPREDRGSGGVVDG